jgi:hypothetical protein
MVDRKLQFVTGYIVGHEKNLFRLESSLLQKKDFTRRHRVGIHAFFSGDRQQMQIAVGLDRIVGGETRIIDQALHIMATGAENVFVVDIKWTAELSQ